MNKLITIVFIGVLLTTKANGQITKGNWLVGGSGRYSSQIESLYGERIKGRSLDIATNEGYFFVDRLAGGIILSFQYQTVKRPNITSSSSTNLGVGPFLRYYVFPADNRINILAQTAYKYSRPKSSGEASTQNDLTFSAGPVLFFNQSVGIELTGNYELYNHNKASTTARTFYVAIGFQIHLEKDRNQ